MTREFDRLVENLGFGMSIARGINRTKNLHQIPDRWRAKPFKKNYTPMSKTTRPTINVAKKKHKVLKPVSGNVAVDTANKYGFDLPKSGKSKQLGSTGITLTRRANDYVISKK